MRAAHGMHMVLMHSHAAEQLEKKAVHTCPEALAPSAHHVTDNSCGPLQSAVALASWLAHYSSLFPKHPPS